MTSTTTSTLLSLLLSLSVGCTKATSAGQEGAGAKLPPSGDVTVELSGVTLGDDCPENWTPPAPAAPNPASPAKPSEAPAAAPMRNEATPSAVAPADCAEPGCGGYYRSCQQTSIQLALHANGTKSATLIQIKKVELLDANGTLIDELTSRRPSRWSTAGSYQPWDQMIAPGEQAAVSYVLSSPSWDAMDGGSEGQTGKTFQVRVTVLIGDKDRVVEKKSIQPAIMPPPVPT